MTTDRILHLDFIIKKRISERLIIDGIEIKRTAEIFVWEVSFHLVNWNIRRCRLLRMFQINDAATNDEACCT